MLHLAVYHNKQQLVARILGTPEGKELVKYADQVEFCLTENQDTPLHIAASRNNFEMFMNLIENGAKLNTYNVELQLPINLCSNEEFYSKLVQNKSRIAGTGQENAAIIEEFVKWIEDMRGKIKAESKGEDDDSPAANKAPSPLGNSKNFKESNVLERKDDTNKKDKEKQAGGDPRYSQVIPAASLYELDADHVPLTVPKTAQKVHEQV